MGRVETVQPEDDQLIKPASLHLLTTIDDNIDNFYTIITSKQPVGMYIYVLGLAPTTKLHGKLLHTW